MGEKIRAEERKIMRTPRNSALMRIAILAVVLIAAWWVIFNRP